jgi:hypothetical protein
MSYGFDLFPGDDKYDEDEVLDLLKSADQDDVDVAALEARNQKIITAILQQHSHFETFTDDFIYQLLSDAGIQIYLSRRSLGIGVSLPYWYEDGEGQQVFAELKQCLQLIQSITQYPIYDSQIDKVIDLNQDWGEVLSSYGFGVDFVRKYMEDNNY